MNEKNQLTTPRAPFQTLVNMCRMSKISEIFQQTGNEICLFYHHRLMFKDSNMGKHVDYGHRVGRLKFAETDSTILKLPNAYPWLQMIFSLKKFTLLQSLLKPYTIVFKMRIRLIFIIIVKFPQAFFEKLFMTTNFYKTSMR